MSIHTPIPSAAAPLVGRDRPLPTGTTYLLISEDIVHETQVGFAWADALALLWNGEFEGTPRLIAVDLDHGTAVDCTNAALIDLSDRAQRDGNVPAHLEPHFGRAGLPVSCGDPVGCGRQRQHIIIDQSGGRFSRTGYGGRA